MGHKMWGGQKVWPFQIILGDRSSKRVQAISFGDGHKTSRAIDNRYEQGGDQGLTQKGFGEGTTGYGADLDEKKI